jgi:hypothetical protein
MVTALGTAAIWHLNETFAPEMYSKHGPIAMGHALASGMNYATYDLNINIREMKEAQIDRMHSTPEVVVLGASHWQEANRDLLPHKKYYNAHIHRDYYEDMLGVVEMFVRHGKLPKQMIISIRDNLFTAVADRKDYLWLPGAPYARAMSERLGIKPISAWDTLPVQRWREQLSLQMLYTNVSRWAMSTDRPQSTLLRHFNALDTLLPDGSIIWSTEHQRLFTRDRTEKLSIAFAEQNKNAPLRLDPEGIAAIDTLLAYLKKNNVEVFLAHPPFNPDYYNRIRNTPYETNLRKVEKLTQDLASKYGWQVIGSFDPEPLGCTADMFIDAEHAGPECLQSVFAEFVELDTTFRAKDIRISAAPSLTLPTQETVAAALVAALGYGHNGIQPRDDTAVTTQQPESAPSAVAPTLERTPDTHVVSPLRPQSSSSARDKRRLGNAAKKNRGG